MNDLQQDILARLALYTSDGSIDGLLLECIHRLMSARLAEQREIGFGGWHTPKCSNEDLMARLKKNLGEGDMLDVINLAAMIHLRKIMFPNAEWL